MQLLFGVSGVSSVYPVNPNFCFMPFVCTNFCFVSFVLLDTVSSAESCVSHTFVLGTAPDNVFTYYLQQTTIKSFMAVVVRLVSIGQTTTPTQICDV